MSAKKNSTRKKRVKKATSKKRRTVKPAASTRKSSRTKAVAKKKTRAMAVSRQSADRKVSKSTSLGRPRVSGTAELNLLFQRDRDAREVFTFLCVKTLNELEGLSADEIIERLTAPMLQTVDRTRKALAMNNRCLQGDQMFAVDFKKQLS